MAKLEAENKDLTAQVKEFDAKMKVLESQLSALQPQAPPQKDIDLLVQISNASRTVLEKLPNDLQRRAQLLKDSGYLEGGKYSPIIGHEIRLSPKGREFLDKAGLL
jgi:predicted RNase H-like nuclease (RuvC/YqgF family)